MKRSFTYEQLEAFLRDWRNWGDPEHGAYDANGLFWLFLAVVENMTLNSTNLELGDICDELEEQHLELLASFIAGAEERR